MAKFSWDSQEPAPSQQNEKPAKFSWDNQEPAEEINSLKNDPNQSKATAMAAGAASGATLGLADEAGAIGSTVMNALTGFSGPLAGGSMGDLMKEYQSKRDDLRATMAKIKAANPKTFMASELGGGLVSGGAFGGVPKTMGKASLQGASMGAIAGLGGSNADLTRGDYKGAAYDTAIGTGLGAGLGAGGYMVGKGISSVIDGRLASGVKKLAEKSAVKATGATGLQASRFDMSAGRELLDQGIVSFGDNQEQIAQKAAAALQKSGDDISQSLRALDEQGAGLSYPEIVAKIRARSSELADDPANYGVSDSLAKLADRIESSAIAKHEAAIAAKTPQFKPSVKENVSAGEDFDFGAVESSRPVSRPMGKRAAGPTENLDYVSSNKLKQMIKDGGINPDTGYEIDIDAAKQVLARRADGLAEREVRAYQNEVNSKNGSGSFENAVPDTSLAPKVPLAKAEETKRGFQNSVNYNSPKNDVTVADEAANIYRRSVEAEAARIDPTISEKFLEDKKNFGLLSPITKAAERRALTLQQSPMGGLLDVSAAAVGSVKGGVPGAVIAPIARRFISPRIASSVAVSADKVANILQKAPDAFGKFAPILQAAAQKGSQALTAANEFLKRDPQYLQVLESLASNDATTPNVVPPNQTSQIATSEQGDRSPSQLKGQALWIQKGADKLGIDPSVATSNNAKFLLMQAAELPANSKKLQEIKNKIMRGNK